MHRPIVRYRGLRVVVGSLAGVLIAVPGVSAQTINETQPGGVENRPSGEMRSYDGSSRSAAPPASAQRSFRAPSPTVPLAGGAAPYVAKDAKSEAAETSKSEAAAGAKAKKKKATSPDKAMPPVMERAPASESAPPPAPSRAPMPLPRRPDESIPGGVERSPGNGL